MAFEFDANAVFRSACAFLAKGIYPVKLHGITPDGYCTCGQVGHHVNGAVKRQCGKHPIGDAWQNRVARNEGDVEEWLNDDSPFNIGILLGPRSGVIDLEWDDEEAKAYAVSVGLTELLTPTYVSGRSEHRLCLWDDRFSQIEKAVIHPHGLEVRLGVGKKASQSVVPPSWHWKGRVYQWKPTLSIEEVDIAPVPDFLVRSMMMTAAAGSGANNRGKKRSARWAIHGAITEGNRHPTLLALCTKLVMRSPCFESDEEQDDIYGLVWNTNKANCVPPKSREEVAAILNSCLQYRRTLEAEGRQLPQTPKEIEEAAEEVEKASDGQSKPPVTGSYALHGLELRPVPGNDQGEWLPGQWFIQVVNSDPAEIILNVPRWEDTPCKGKVALTLDEFRSAKQVASKVFHATRRVILDGDRGEWERIWRGQDGNSKRPTIPGLMEKLMVMKDSGENAGDIDVGASSLRFAVLASYLVDVFSKATTASEDKPEPNSSGRACWVTPDELWFKWAKTWEDIGRMHDVQAGERIKIKHMLCNMMGVNDLPEKRHTFGNTRHSYVVFSPEWVEATKRLADGESPHKVADGKSPHKAGEMKKFQGSKSAVDSASLRQEHLSPLLTTT